MASRPRPRAAPSRPSSRSRSFAAATRARAQMRSSPINGAPPLPFLSTSAPSLGAEAATIDMQARKISVSELKGGSELVRKAHMSVRLLQPQGLVVLARTETPFETAQEVDACVADLRRAVPLDSRPRFCMLVDMRRAPIRVHPALDPAFFSRMPARSTELGLELVDERAPGPRKPRCFGPGVARSPFPLLG
jgi:hypothetical protein